MSRFGLWKNLQLYGWLAFFLYMILLGRESSYLADLQGDVLLAGTVLLIVVLLADLTQKSTEKARDGGYRLPWRHRLALAVETSGHWVPLILALLMGVTTLNMDAASLRNGIQMRVYDPARQTGAARYDPSRLGPGEFFTVTLIDLYSNPDLETDVRVELTGRITHMTGEEVRKRFPERGDGGVFVLYRFAIACCAADATPLAVVLENLPSENMPKEGEWLTVQGVTHLLPGEPKIVALRIETMKTIPQPKRPYLSWLDAS
ncbi:MAG: hypothetical protein HQL75_16890 [Magnetococcales bacterium]|nr:hypothetical protein [Magnetococcales bacterium]